MNHYQYFFGVDISKKTLDITLLQEGVPTHRQFTNDAPGMGALMQWLGELQINFEHALFCMEATGLYCFVLTQFLAEQGIDTWVEQATQIKKAAGLERGKTDKVDSRRIAQYAFRNVDRARLWKPTSATLQKIRHLSTLRERLVDTKKRLLTPIQEFEAVGNQQMAKLLRHTIRATLAALDKDLRHTEAKIKDIVNGDENLKKLFTVITSVVGIGFVTAINLLVHTAKALPNCGMPANWPATAG